jgi:hypothetical protein
LSLVGALVRGCGSVNRGVTSFAAASRAVRGGRPKSRSMVAGTDE